MVLVAIVTSALSPWLFSTLCPVREKHQRKGVIIAGTDHIAELLARRVSNWDIEVTLVGNDLTRLQEIRHAGFKVVEGPPEDEAVLREAGAANAETLVAMAGNSAVRQTVCTLARNTFEIPHVIARVSSVRLLKRLKEMSVKCVQPALAMVIALEGALRFPTAFEDLLEHEAEVELGEAVLRNTDLEGLPLRLLQLPGNALIVSIRRESTVLVPHGETTLEDGDHLALIGSHESVCDARELLEV